MVQLLFHDSGYARVATREWFHDSGFARVVSRSLFHESGYAIVASGISWLRHHYRSHRLLYSGRRSSGVPLPRGAPHTSLRSMFISLCPLRLFASGRSFWILHFEFGLCPCIRPPAVH